VAAGAVVGLGLAVRNESPSLLRLFGSLAKSHIYLVSGSAYWELKRAGRQVRVQCWDHGPPVTSHRGVPDR